MIYTTQRNLKEMRELSGQNPNTRTRDSDIEFMRLDNAQRQLSEIVIANRPDALAFYFDLALDGSLEYYIPDSINFDYEEILMVTELSDSTYEFPTEAFDWFDRMSVSPHTIAGSAVIGGEKLKWEVRGNYIEFPSRADNMTVRVWYTRYPVGFFYGACGATVTNNTVIFPTTPTGGEILKRNDYYNGMRLYNGADGLVYTISDYVASTNTATVSSNWSVNPTATSTVIEIVSPLPERIHDLIPAMAAGVIKVSNDDNTNQLEAMIENRVSGFLTRFRKPQSQEPDRIRKVLRY
jgi:hypothetical protein